MPMLAVTVSGVVTTDGNRVSMPAKTLTGLQELASSWPGEVAFVTCFKNAAVPMSAPTLSSLGFGLHLSTDRVKTIRTLNPDVVSVTLASSELPILEASQHPLVVLAENSLSGRLAWAIRSSPHGRLSIRHRAGLYRLEMRYRRALRRASGVQFNGHPAKNAYRSLNDNAMLFFDSRLRAEDLSQSLERTQATPVARRFAFSGRWLRPKGFEEALLAFQRANRALAGQMQLFLMGDGPLRSLIPKDSSIIKRGNLDFEEQWIPEVRSSVDALLIPHTQPDPACTYLEGAGLGAPFVSFKNAAAHELSTRYGFGWTADLGDVEALSELIIAVATDTADYARRRQAGIDFMRRHSFEQEFSRRTEHFLRTSRKRAIR